MKNQTKSKEVKNSKKTVASKAKKTKLSVKLKALIYSTVSLVCVAGIVLGIVFGIKGKGDEPPTNPNGPNSGIKFSAAQQLLADDISSNVKYTVADIVTAVPYSSECTVEDLTRFGDNYFAYTDESGNEQFWTYSKKDGVPTKARNITSSVNGFVDGSAVGYEIKGFNGDYVLIANLYSSDPFSGNEYTEVVFRLISIKNPEMPREIFRFDTRGKEYTMYDDFFVLKDNYFAVAYYSEFNISRLTANWNVYYYSYSDAFINQEYEYQNNSVSGINVQLEEENFKWQFNNNGFYILNEGEYSYYSVSKNGFAKIEKEIELNNNSEIDVDYRFIEISKDRLLVEKVDYVETVSEFTANTIKEESRTQAGVFTHANYTYELYDTSGYSAEVVSLETKNGYPKLASLPKSFEMIDDHYVIVYQKTANDRTLEEKYVVSYFNKNQNEVASFETTLENEHIVYASSNTFVTEQNIYQPKNSVKMTKLFDFAGKDFVINANQTFNQDYLILTNLAQTKAGIIDVWGNVLIDPTTSDYSKIVEIVGSHCVAQVGSNETYLVNLKTLSEPKQISNYVASNVVGKGTGLVTIKDASLQQYELKNMNGAKLLDGYDIVKFNTPNMLAGHEVLEVVTTKDRSKPSHYIVFKNVNKNETSSYVSYAFSESNGQDLSPVADTYATSVDFTAKYWNDTYGDTDIIGTASVSQAKHPTVTAQLKDSWCTYDGSIYMKTSNNGSQLGIQDLYFSCYMASIDNPITSPYWTYKLGYNVSSLYSNPTVTLDKTKNYGYKIVFRINYVNEKTFIGIVISSDYSGVQMDYAHDSQGGSRMRHEISFSAKSREYDSTARKQRYPMFDDNVNKVNTFNTTVSNPDWEWNEDMNLDTSNSQIYHKPRVNGSASIVAPSVEDVGTNLKYGHLSYWRYSVNGSGTADYLYYNKTYYNDSNIAKSGYTLSGTLNPNGTYTFTSTFNDYWYSYFFAYYVENTADIYLNDTLYQDNWGTTQLTNAFSMPTKTGYNFAGWSFTGLVDTLEFYGVEKAHTATFYKADGTSKVVTFEQDVDENGNKLGTGYLPAQEGYTSVKFSWLTEPHESEVYIEEVFTPKTYTITLDHDIQRTFTNAGTCEIYYRYDDGFYLDFDFTLRMTETENPITMPIAVGYKTEAQYTFTPDLITYGLTGGEGNLYVTWEDEDEIEMINNFVENYHWRSAEAPWTAIHYTVVWENYCRQEETITEETKLVAYDEVFSLPVPPSLYHDFTGFIVTSTPGGGTAYYGSSSSNLIEFSSTESLVLSELENGASYLYFKNLWQDVNPEFSAADSHGNVIISSNWIGKQYTVEFEMNGGTPIDSITCYYNSSLLGSLPSIPAVPYKVGYNFAGWDVSGMDTAPGKVIYENTTGDDVYVDGFTQSVSLDATYSQATFNNLSGTEGTVVFSARWTPATYSIVYDLSCVDASGLEYSSPSLQNGVGWLGTENHPSSAVYEQSFYVDTPDRSVWPLGFQFAAWIVDGYGSGAEFSTAANGNYTNLSVPGGGVPMYNMERIYFRNLGANEGDVITIKAMWAGNTYKITYDLNGENASQSGGSSFNQTSISFGSLIWVTDPTRIGYTFIGWSLSGLSDEVDHFYDNPSFPNQITFNSINGKYYDDTNPNNDIIPSPNSALTFKNLNHIEGLTVTLTAHWTPNNYNITYHYAKDATFSTFPNLNKINTIANMRYSKTHTVTYDRYFKTLGVGAIETDTTIVAPTGYKLVGWMIFVNHQYESTSTSVTMTFLENYFEYANSDVLFDYAFASDNRPMYVTTVGDMHAYAVYESIQITVKYYAPDPAAAGYNDGACINDLSTYTFQNQATFAYGASVRHSKMLMDGVHFSTNYLISPNLYVEGGMWKSYTTYQFNSTSYYTYAGVSMPWGLSNNLCHDPDNPVFYAYAEYNEDYDGDIDKLQFQASSLSDKYGNILTVWVVSAYASEETSLKIPNRYNNGYYDLPVYCVGSFGESNIVSITIPSNVVQINSQAFMNCFSLENVIFEPNSKLDAIGGYAFEGCSNLTSFDMPDSVTSVGWYAFTYTALNSIHLSNSLTVLSEYMFDNSSISTIEIPNSVTDVYLNAFNDSALTELHIPATVTYVYYGESNFISLQNLEEITVDPANPYYDSRNNCNAIIEKAYGGILVLGCKNTQIPEGIKSIGPNSFYNSLIGEDERTLIIPEGVVEIGIGAFLNCEYLSKIEFPTTLKYISDSAFAWCTSLDNVILPNNIVVIDLYSFYQCSSLTSIVIPGDSGNVYVGDAAFASCYSLEFIFVEEGVTYLGSYAFADCGTDSYTQVCVYLPSTLQDVGSYIFDGFGSYSQYQDRIYFGLSSSAVNERVNNGYWSDCCLLNEYDYTAIDASITYYGTPKGAYSAILNYTDYYYYTWMFSVTGDDYDPYVIATRYIGDESEVTVPAVAKEFASGNDMSSVEVLNVGMNVESLTFNTEPSSLTQLNLTYGLKSLGHPTKGLNVPGIRSLYIPASVEYIAPYFFKLGFWCGYEEFTVQVDPDNPYYDSRENCNAIIETATNTLVAGHNGSTIPSSVVTIGSNSLFISPVSLDPFEYVIPGNVKLVKSNAITTGNYMTTITFEEGLVELENQAIESLNYDFTLNLPSTVSKIGTQVVMFNGYGSYVLILIDSGNPYYHISNGAVVKTATNTLIWANFLSGGQIDDSITTIGEYAFYTTINDYYFSLQIPESVTRIEKYAFMGCSFSQPILLTNVKYIGSYAFSGCIFNDVLSLGEKLEVMGEAAFEFISGMSQTLEIPATLKVIPANAFQYSSVGEVVFNEGLLSIETAAFQESSITRVILPNSLINLKLGAFYSCKALTEVYIGPVTNIYANVFNYCDLLSSLTIAEGVNERTIGDYAFSFCSSLVNLVIPEGFTSIGNQTFLNCGNLTSIKFPDTLNNIGDDAFWGAGQSSGEILEIDFGIADRIWNIGSSAFMRSTVKTVNLGFFSFIGVSAFNDCQNLTSFRGIGVNSATIDDAAFNQCSNLSDVVISGSITKIGEQAFYQCTKLKTISLPSDASYCSIYKNAFKESGLTHIEIPSIYNINTGAFDNCTSLTHIWFESGVSFINGSIMSGSPVASIYTNASKTSVENQWGTAWRTTGQKNPPLMYYGSTLSAYYTARYPDFTFTVSGSEVTLTGYSGSATEVIIPSFVTIIGASAFSGNTTIEKVVVPYGVHTINNNAFDSDTSLSQIILPETLITIKHHAFQNCINIVEIVLPNSLQQIDGGAFDYTGIESVYIPANVSSLTTPFANAEYITSIEVDPSNLYYDSRNNCNAIIEIATNTLITGCINTIIPNGVVTIGSYAFANKGGIIEELELPDTVTTIQSYAFTGSSLKSIYLNNVERIETYAFSSTSHLETITVGSFLKYIGVRAFAQATALKELDLSHLINTLAIYDYAFYNTTSLKTIKLPKMVDLAQRSYIFSYSGLETIDLTGVEFTNYYLPAYTFSNCKNLVSAKLSQSITSPGTYMFSGCSALKEVYLGENVTSISQNLFSNCTSLETVNIPNTVVEIRSGAFNNCEKLKNILIPRSVTNIYAGFKNCKSLTAIWIPSTAALSASSSTSSPFYGCSSTLKIYTDSSMKQSTWGTYYNYYSSSGKLNVTFNANYSTYFTAVYPDFSATGTGSAYLTLTGYTGAEDVNLKIPYGIQSINSNAFTNLNFIEVYIPSSLKQFNNAIFKQCLIDVVRVQEGIQQFSANWFSKCTIGDIHLPSTINNFVVYANSKITDSVGEYAQWIIPDKNETYFIANEDYIITKKTNNLLLCLDLTMTELSIPEYVATIGNYAFYANNNLTDITIPDQIVEIGQYAFSNCSKLANISFEEGSMLKKINEGAFYALDSQYTDMDIVFPDSLEYIGNSAFHSSSLWMQKFSFSFGKNIKFIDYRFASAKVIEDISIADDNPYYSDNDSNIIIEKATGKLVKVSMSITEIPDSVKIIGRWAFNALHGLTEMLIPSNVIAIENEAFYNAGIEKIIFSEGLKSIADYAFYNSDGFTQLVLPNSLEYIGRNVFASSDYLNSVYIGSNVKYIGVQAFDNAKSTCVIYCADHEKPVDWTTKWNYASHVTGKYYSVVWGYDVVSVQAEYVNGAAGAAEASFESSNYKNISNVVVKAVKSVSRDTWLENNEDETF